RIARRAGHHGVEDRPPRDEVFEVQEWIRPATCGDPVLHIPKRELGYRIGIGGAEDQGRLAEVDDPFELAGRQSRADGHDNAPGPPDCDRDEQGLATAWSRQNRAIAGFQPQVAESTGQRPGLIADLLIRPGPVLDEKYRSHTVLRDVVVVA